MTGIDEVILCGNKAKNAGIAAVTTRLFNEVNAQKNKSKRSGYFFTMPYYHAQHTKKELPELTNSS